MRRISLNLKLILSFIAVVIVFIFISYMLIFSSFERYYHDDVYRVLEDNSDMAQSITDIEEFVAKSNQDNAHIEQMYWIKLDGKLIRKEGNKNLTEDIINEIEGNISSQIQASKRYSLDVDGRKLFYIITKYGTNADISSIDKIGLDSQWNIVSQLVEGDKNAIYRATFRWEPHNGSLKKRLYNQMVLMMLLAALAMLIGFYILSRYLTRPLIKLSRDVKNISKRQLDTPIIMDRKDEIGFLAHTIEDMRKQLLSHDKEQKLNMHSISHELKTPIMIIQSYVDALQRGLYINGTPEASYKVIDDECKRLNRLVSNLLYIQRLDYYDSDLVSKDKINISEVVREVIGSLSIKLKELDVKLNLKNLYVIGSYNQIKVVIENIMSNQIRYAESQIRITLKKEKNKILLEIYNDGPHIDDDLNIFNMFEKGDGGQSGIGLYIVKRLVNLNSGEIESSNEASGVLFTIRFAKP